VKSAPRFWDARTGALAVTYGTQDRPTELGMLVTSDAGASWSLAATIPLSVTEGNAVPVAFMSSSDWVLLPDGGTLLRTTDAGRTWASSSAAGLPGAPDSLLMADARHGWALVPLSVCLTFKSNCQSRTALSMRRWMEAHRGRPSGRADRSAPRSCAYLRFRCRQQPYSPGGRERQDR
jgi:photosystem II stability/assembly factor-like uncharacterized protein